MNPRLTQDRLGFDESDPRQGFPHRQLPRRDRNRRPRADRALGKNLLPQRSVGIHPYPGNARNSAGSKPGSSRSASFPASPAIRKKDHQENLVEAGDLSKTVLPDRYVGQKRFSREGGETLNPLPRRHPRTCGKESGRPKSIMGMAHADDSTAGQLPGQVLVLHPPRVSENYVPDTATATATSSTTSGFENQRKASDGHEVDIRLAAQNHEPPRSRQPGGRGARRAPASDIRGDVERKAGAALLIHGDAAIRRPRHRGGGLAISHQLQGYRTGDHPHRREQPDRAHHRPADRPAPARYARMWPRIVEAPIFHSTGNDPLAVVAPWRWAFDYKRRPSDCDCPSHVLRAQARHNESDEPVTQPCSTARSPEMKHRENPGGN